MVATQEKSSNLIETTKKVTSQWVSLIYLPGNEINVVSNDFLISGIRPNQRIPFYRTFQYLDQDTKETLSISIHPGTNMGYHVRNISDNTERVFKLPTKVFQTIFDQPLNAPYLERDIIIPVYPVNNTENLDGMPQYADFELNDAIRLVQNHTHEKWINWALVSENRAAVKTEADKRKEQILQHRKKLQEGLV